MIQLAPLPLEPPRISANQLGEFIFASERKRVRILHDQKFGNISAAPYYSAASAGALRAFTDGHFSRSGLAHEASLLAVREAETPRQTMKWANNVLALRSLAEMGDELQPPAGEHRLLRRNAQVVLQGVTISVFPEIVTENLTNGFIAFTKLRFSKSKIAEDLAEIVLLILHYYGQRQSRAGLQFSFERSKVIDCFSKTVIPGHAVARHRDQQLHQALAEINWLWPRIAQND